MNQHYEFWVSYYEELEGPGGKLTEEQVQKNNDRLTGHRWQPGALALPCQEQSFCAQVCYPGLLVGLGNSHDSGMTDAETQLGITLDPVTGLPFLPGSTVKGLLRSAFLQNRDYVAALLEEQGLRLNERQVEALELDSFGRQHPHGSYESAAEDREGRDVFFDAYPVQPDAQQRLLGLENITPHRTKLEGMDGLTAPVPLTLLKVMPGVVFQFRFRLEDSVLGKGEGAVTVNAEQKRALFRALLLDLGAGAKTNVGFGALKEFKTEEKAFRYLEQLPEKTGSSVQSKEDIQVGMVLKGKVNRIAPGYATVVLIDKKLCSPNGVKGKLDLTDVPEERKQSLSAGSTISVKVLGTKNDILSVEWVKK